MAPALHPHRVSQNSSHIHFLPQRLCLKARGWGHSCFHISLARLCWGAIAFGPIYSSCCQVRTVSGKHVSSFFTFWCQHVNTVITEPEFSQLAPKTFLIGIPVLEKVHGAIHLSLENWLAQEQEAAHLQGPGQPHTSAPVALTSQLPMSISQRTATVQQSQR